MKRLLQGSQPQKSESATLDTSDMDGPVLFQRSHRLFCTSYVLSCHGSLSAIGHHVRVHVRKGMCADTRCESEWKTMNFI